MSVQQANSSEGRAPARGAMEFAEIAGTALEVSRVALGTWAIGGWMWGGSDEKELIATIRAALAHGITLIDTAPVYGFGRSEEIVGKALADGLRADVLIATKVGLEWHDGKITRNGSRERIMREIEDSLRRLRTDRIDIYQVHWPDPNVPIAETAGAMRELYEQGTIRAIGVSNFSVKQMEEFRGVEPAACAATAVQSVRARHRGGHPALLPEAPHRHARLWSALPGSPVRTDAGGHEVHRR